MGAVQAVETIRLGVRMDTMAARMSGDRYNTYFSCEHLFGRSAAEAAHEGCRGARSRGRLRGRGSARSVSPAPPGSWAPSHTVVIFLHPRHVERTR